MVTAHLLCAKYFHVIITPIPHKATMIPVLERKKLRLGEHSHLPEDAWLLSVRPSL